MLHGHCDFSKWSPLTLFARIATECRAAIAPTFALLIIPLLGGMGFAIDLSMMLAEKTRAQNIADAGVINGIRAVQAYMATNGNTVTVFNQIQTTAQTQSQSFMAGLAAQDTNMVGAAPAVAISYNSSTSVISASATLNFTFQPAFMGLFGINSVPTAVPSSASMSVTKFTQVVFLVDVSGSMGVAATPSDMTKLVALTNQLTSGNYPCAFACHQSPTGYW